MFNDNPACVNRLAPEERADYRWGVAKLAQVIEAAGFATLVVGGDFSEDAFIDRCHLSEEGGRELARAVAPKVRELAHRLGYSREIGKP
jgi:hypothetical protein